MGPSDMFGELVDLRPGLRTSSATTVTEVRKWCRWDRDASAQVGSRSSGDRSEQLLRVLARRLRRTNNNG